MRYVSLHVFAVQYVQMGLIHDRSSFHAVPLSSPLRLSDLYSILRTTDVLERAYIRDAMHADEYDRECSKLIQQFRVLYGTIKDKVREALDVHGLSTADAYALSFSSQLRSYVSMASLNYHPFTILCLGPRFE